MNRKNIGLLVPALYGGGAERVASRLSWILSDDYNVFMILFDAADMEYECGGTMIDMGIPALSDSNFQKRLLPFKRALKLKRLKRKYKLDAVISFMASPNIVNVLSRIKNCRTIISIRNFNTLIENEPAHILSKYLYGKADYVVSVSKVITEKMVSQYNIDRAKAITIYNPYDISQIQTLAKEDLNICHREFYYGAFVFVCVGRQIYQKGLWHLVKAFKLVNDSNNRAKLVIIGKDYQDGKVPKLIEQLHLDDQILLTGLQANPFKFMSRSEAYVLSSLFEGFPNSMVEAMACGCSIIAADCKSGPREILFEKPDIGKEAKDVEYADFGILTPPLEAEENWDPSSITNAEIKLAEAMLIYLNDQNIRGKYARRAMERASQFSYDTCRHQYNEILP